MNSLFLLLGSTKLISAGGLASLDGRVACAGIGAADSRAVENDAVFEVG